MALPNVNGWLIDFRTARVIFAGRGNILVTTLVGLCQSGDLQYCHCEHSDFRTDPNLCGPFVEEHACRSQPSKEVMLASTAIVGGHYNKPLLKSDVLTVFLISTALTHQFGIITNIENPAFSTARDIGPPLGVHVLTSEQFEAAL
jgi:hypothetical protein